MHSNRDALLALVCATAATLASSGCEGAREPSETGALEAAPATDDSEAPNAAEPADGDESESESEPPEPPGTPSASSESDVAREDEGAPDEVAIDPGDAIDDADESESALPEPAGAETEAADGAEVTPTFHVFLLLGQSNMAGYPKAQPEDRTEDPRVRVLGFDDCAATGRRTDEWDVAAPPLHECWNDGLGPGDYFAKTLLEVLPEQDSIGLVPCAISGERIEPFLKVGGSRYDYIVRRARLAQQAGGVIEGFLFHQGESNSGDPSWPGKVATLVTDLRTDLGLGDAPFLAGELLYTGGTSGHNVRVRQLPDVLDNAYVISAEGLVVDPADTQYNLHFDRDSQVEFGKRYANTMIEALGLR